MIIFILLVVVSCYYQTHITYILTHIYIYICTMYYYSTPTKRLQIVIFHYLTRIFLFDHFWGCYIYMIYNTQIYTQIVQVTSCLR